MCSKLKTFHCAVMIVLAVLITSCVILANGAILPPSTDNTEALNYVRSLNPKKIILDVDAGVDDALAILLTLAKPRPHYPEIIAITCTHGNTNVTNVVINVLKTLRVVKKKIPVYMGAYGSLMVTPESDDFFGKDGFGDVANISTPSLDEAEEDPAAVALTKLAKKYSGEITIVALGPLSNLALAVKLDPTFSRNIKELIWLGGSVEGIGNIKPGIEFNAFMDPEANFIIFNMTNIPIFLFSWETCIYHSAVSKEWRMNVLWNVDSTVMHFLNAIEAKSLNVSKRWSPCDAKAMAMVLDPSMVTKAVLHNIYPAYQGDAKGALLVDYKDSIKARKNAVIIKEIDADAFKNMCLTNLS